MPVCWFLLPFEKTHPTNSSAITTAQIWLSCLLTIKCSPFHSRLILPYMFLIPPLLFSCDLPPSVTDALPWITQEGRVDMKWLRILEGISVAFEDVGFQEKGAVPGAFLYHRVRKYGSGENGGLRDQLSHKDPSAYREEVRTVVCCTWPCETKGSYLTDPGCSLRGLLDFLGGPVVKNPPANAGDSGSIPGPGRFHMPWSN